MYEVNYHKASSVKEAVSKAGEDALFLSGGQTLIPTMKARLNAPSDLIDVSGIADMQGVSVKGSTVTIGAATTHADVASNADLQKSCGGLACLAAGIGDPAVRHRGTIGGSVANNDPAADYPAAMLALDATIKTDKREIAAADFFVGQFETALKEGEMIVSISFDAPSKAAYAKFPNPASRYAMVGAFAAHGSGGARVAITGAGSDGVYRQSDMEAALDKDWSPDALAGVQIGSEGLMSDIHADATYRANLVSVMAKRAVAAAS